MPGVTPSLLLLLVALLRMHVICPGVAAVCRERKSAALTGVRITGLLQLCHTPCWLWGHLHLPMPQFSHLLMGITIWAHPFVRDCGEVHMSYKP